MALIATAMQTWRNVKGDNAVKPALSSFLKTASVYMVGNVLSKIVALLLLPVYTTYLSPEEYGEYDLLYTIVNLVSPVLFCQIWDGMYRFAFDGGEERRDQCVNNSLVVCLFGSVAYLVLYCFVTCCLGMHLSVFAVVYGLLLSLQYEASYCARAYFCNMLFSVSGVINAVVSAVIGLLLLCFFSWGQDALFLSAALGNLVQVIVVFGSLGIIKKFTIKDVSKSLIKQMVRFSIPLCLASLSFWLFSGFAKVVVSMMLGTAENGLYGVIMRFTAAITLVASVFQFAWNEASYKMANNDSRLSLYSSATNMLFELMLAVSAAFPLVVSLVFPYMVDARYSAAVLLLPAATLGTAINSFSSFLATIFSTEKNTGLVFTSTVIGAIANMLLCPFLIMIMGLSGALWALCLSYGAVAVIRLGYLHVRCSIKLEAQSLLATLPLIIGYIAADYGCIPIQALASIASISLFLWHSINLLRR